MSHAPPEIQRKGTVALTSSRDAGPPSRTDVSNLNQIRIFPG